MNLQSHIAYKANIYEIAKDILSTQEVCMVRGTTLTNADCYVCDLNWIGT